MANEETTQTMSVQEFLNPASMLTPGLAGSVTMFITNALSAHFSLTPSWVGLGISFLCGALVFISSVKLIYKLVYYVLNSLIIFSVAAGTSGFAASATQSASWNFGVPSAYAAAFPQADRVALSSRSLPADHTVVLAGITRVDAPPQEAIKSARRDPAMKELTLAQASPEEGVLQPIEGGSKSAEGVSTPAESTELMEQGTEDRARALEEELEAVRQKLEAAELSAEAADLKVEAARQELEAAMQAAQAAEMEAAAAKAEAAAAQGLEEGPPVKAARTPSKGIFQHWF